MTKIIAKRIRKKGISGILVDAVLYLFALISVIPFVILFFNTFKDKDHIYNALYMPNFLYTENYQKIFEKTDVLGALSNTILICFATQLLMVLFASAAGYVISRSREKIFKFVYLLFVSGLIIPSQTNMIVIYKLGVALHMINTIPFLIMIYVSGSTAFATLIYVGFTKTIPREIEESAGMDGCGRYGLFARIIFPLLMPATGTVLVTTIFWFWNDFSGPLIYLNDKRYQTIIMAIFNFSLDSRSTDWGPVFALCFIASLPMIALFLFTQKYLLKGLTSGAVKG